MNRGRFALAVTLAVVAALLLLPLPEFEWGRRHLILFRELENAGHPLLFAGVACVILRFLSRARTTPYGLTFLACGLLGATTELVQLTVGRDGSLIDFFNDLLGAGAALLLHAWSMGSATANGRGRWQLGLATACAVCAFAPLAWTCAAYVHRSQQLPVLWQATSRLDRVFATTLKREYQGLSVDEPWPDWRAFRTLVVELENPNTSALDVTVRVHDHAHTNAYKDRFNENVTLEAGARRTVRIPIEEIERAPETRQMSLDRIAGVIAFTNDNPRRIDFLRSVALER